MTSKALLVGATSILAIGLVGAGIILLPKAGVHLPFSNGGTATDAPPGQAATGGGAGPASGPSNPPPEPVPGNPTDAPAGPAPGTPTDAPAEPVSAGATPSPPQPAPPPTGEPPPPPRTGYRTSSYDVPNGTSRPPLVRGELIWYARSVGVSAVISSSRVCAAAVFTGYSGSHQVARIATRSRCGNVTVSQNLNGRTTPEGITHVVVDLYVNGRRIGRDNCLRVTARCAPA